MKLRLIKLNNLTTVTEFLRNPKSFGYKMTASSPPPGILQVSASSACGVQILRDCLQNNSLPAPEKGGPRLTWRRSEPASCSVCVRVSPATLCKDQNPCWKLQKTGFHKPVIPRRLVEG